MPVGIKTKGKHKQFVERCTLEWCKDKGAIYVHGPDGTTLLRITGVMAVEKFITLGAGNMIDVQAGKHSVPHKLTATSKRTTTRASSYSDPPPLEDRMGW